MQLAILDLNSAGSVASIISLGISIWLLWSVRKIRQSLAMRVRLPQIERSLKNQLKALRTHLTRKRWSAARTSVTRLDADLESLRPWIENAALMARISATHEKIAVVIRAGISDQTSASALQIGAEVDGIIQSLQHVRRDTEVSDHG